MTWNFPPTTAAHSRSRSRSLAILTQYLVATVFLISLAAAISVAVTSSVADQQERAMEGELDRIASETATSIEEADSLTSQTEATAEKADSPNPPAAGVTVDLPRTIGDATYVIRVSGDEVVIELTGGGETSVEKRATFDTTHDVTAQGSAAGGPITIFYDPAEDKLVITSRYHP